MIKFGYSLYRIQPNLPNKRSIFSDPKRFMTLAIDVNGGMPTVATIAVCNDVCDPSLAHYGFHFDIMSPRMDIISIEKMQTLARKAIVAGLDHHIRINGYYPAQSSSLSKYSKSKPAPNRPKPGSCVLPKYLLIIRGGVDKGQIPMVLTKEIAGIKRAIFKIKRTMKAKYAPFNKNKSWKPKLIVVMYNKRVSEKIYEYQHTDGRLKYSLPSRPCIVQQAIMSADLWDTLMYVCGATDTGTRTKNTAKQTVKPSKVTILDFGGDERKNPESKTGARKTVWEIDANEVGNLYQLLHAMHYGYGFAVPFSMGPTGLPGVHFIHFVVFNHLLLL